MRAPCTVPCSPSPRIRPKSSWAVRPFSGPSECCVLMEVNELNTSLSLSPRTSTLAVPSAGFTQPSPKLLAILLGGTLGFLIFAVICIFCCVKCWHRRVSEPPQSPYHPSYMRVTCLCDLLLLCFSLPTTECPYCRLGSVPDPTVGEAGRSRELTLGQMASATVSASLPALPTPPPRGTSLLEAWDPHNSLLLPGQRQAERMSQIKRLLSEKKTCQCPQ